LLPHSKTLEGDPLARQLGIKVPPVGTAAEEIPLIEHIKDYPQRIRAVEYDPVKKLIYKDHRLVHRQFPVSQERQAYYEKRRKTPCI
jgi:hypothetical protein